MIRSSAADMHHQQRAGIMGSNTAFGSRGSRRMGPWWAVVIVMFMGFWATTAQAQSTYSYTGALYSGATNFTTCEAGDCQNFAASQSVSLSFQTAAPLSPNLSSVNVASLVTAFTASDGLTTYSSGDAQSYIFTLTVSTDLNGAITSATATVLRHRTATLVSAAGAAPYPNPDTKFDTLAVSINGTSFARHNGTCASIGVAPSGRSNSCLTVKVKM
jgi:hypothetical protein